jgi:addiction module HigA family antidote
VREKRGITTDTALRLARHFNTTAQYWLYLQTSYELKQAEREIGNIIKNEIRPLAA